MVNIVCQRSRDRFCNTTLANQVELINLSLCFHYKMGLEAYDTFRQLKARCARSGHKLVVSAPYACFLSLLYICDQVNGRAMRVLAHPARLVARQTRPRLLRPRILFACAIPFRRTVVYADGPADGRAYEIIASDAGPSSSRSQHPFAEAEHEYDQDAAPYEPPIDAEPGKGFITTATPQSDYLPSPPTGPVFTPTTGPQHPFDTHAFVNYLESHGLDLETSQTVMEGTRSMIVERSARTRERMLAKEELENQAYLFKAALNELRTELSVRARNDGTALRTAAGAIRREVEGLEVKIKEDVQTMKHEYVQSVMISGVLTISIEMEMNNRKDDTRTEMKGFDMTIEEINNKFTISLGDLRTEIESAKWDATRRAICE